MNIYSLLQSRLEELKKQETTLEENLIPLDEVREEIKVIKQMLDLPNTLETIKANQAKAIADVKAVELAANDEAKATNERLLEALQSLIVEE